MEYDVFISYSRQDYVDENKQVIPGNIISKIKDLFDANNISYWFDEEGVFSGDAFAPVIARNIKSSKMFLFISSENSNVSEWTSNEIATAHAYKKKIIPFRYDDSVYNDSVIIYIARLDYIEYKSNPSKALPRLLLSIQSYLKEEADKKEQERQEEERRRHAEISRQERAAKLQSLREKIENLENRKFDIEKEILTQEKSLTDLRNEKRILEANIADLQEEEAVLLGHNWAKRAAEDTAEKLNEKTSEPRQKDKTSQSTFFAREWMELKSAMALKHWTVNGIYIAACLVAVGLIGICILIGSNYGTEQTLCACAALSFAGVAALLGLFRTMKNQKGGVVWLFISFVSANIIAFTTRCETYYASYITLDFFENVVLGCELGVWIPFFSNCAFMLLLCTLFIRKNGQSAWSLLPKRTKNFKHDKLYIAYTIIIAFMAIATLMNWTNNKNYIRDFPAMATISPKTGFAPMCDGANIITLDDFDY